MVELVLRAILSLALVVGLLWFVARFSSRRMRGSAHSTVQVVTRQQLARGSSLAVVNVGERTLVLGMTEHQVQLITELDATRPEAVAAVEAVRPEVVTELDDEPAHHSGRQPAHRAEPVPTHRAEPAPAHRASSPAQEPVLRSVYNAKHARVSAASTDAVSTAAESPAAEPPADELPVFEPLAIPDAGVLTRPRAASRPSAPAPALPAQSASEQSGSALAASALAGSVLSGQTWKQAFAAATKRVGKAS